MSLIGYLRVLRCGGIAAHLRTGATAPSVAEMNMSEPTGPPVTVGHRLRIAREFAHLDQEQLAELIGVARSTVSNAETGKVKPRRITLRAWALACGVPLAWLEHGFGPWAQI